jgi:anthranilate/para-aminobenzoate synthase component II
MVVHFMKASGSGGFLHVLTGLEKEQEVLLTHGDSVSYYTLPIINTYSNIYFIFTFERFIQVSQLAPGFKVISTSGDIVSGIENTEKHLYGLQFHPEV